MEIIIHNIGIDDHGKEVHFEEDEDEDLKPTCVVQLEEVEEKCDFIGR